MIPAGCQLHRGVTNRLAASVGTTTLYVAREQYNAGHLQLHQFLEDHPLSTESGDTIQALEASYDAIFGTILRRPFKPQEVTVNIPDQGGAGGGAEGERENAERLRYAESCISFLRFHHPPNSADFAPADFLLISYLKQQFPCQHTIDGDCLLDVLHNSTRYSSLQFYNCR